MFLALICLVISATVADSQSFVAFSAYATAETQYEAASPIPIDGFNVVRFNVGNSFDSASGTFTCPITGYYAFEGQLHNSLSDYPSYGDLMKDDTALTSFSARGGSITSFAVTTSCEEGEIVYLQARPYGNSCSGDTCNFWMGGDDTYSFNVFSGHILSEGL